MKLCMPRHTNGSLGTVIYLYFPVKEEVGLEDDRRVKLPPRNPRLCVRACFNLEMTLILLVDQD